MLEEDAGEILQDYDGNPNHFMTMGYLVREDKRALVRGVINVDGSCRPQMVNHEDLLFRRLLEEVKRLTGYGIVLNTSFNLHGEPLVCSPQDALRTMRDTDSEFMAIGSFLVSQ
jgi:carbamoyltransferase